MGAFLLLGLIPILGGLINIGAQLLLAPLGPAIAVAIYAGLRTEKN